MTDAVTDTVDEDSLSAAYYDIAQLLESAEDSEARVIRVLEQLRALVPYALCAILEALPGRELRLVTPPGTAPAQQSQLLATTTTLLGRLVAEHEQAPEVASVPGMHLAVPLVGFDEVVGVLLVEDPGSAYSERHVRRLSVVAAKLAAAEALAALEGSMPNVLLSDIAMPGETGYDLMRKIVAHKGSAAPPAAAFSAYARGQDLREALASGFQRLLTKPIDPAALITAVRELALTSATTGNDARPGDLEGKRG